MAHYGRMYRIFVSSTFGDLVAERDALQSNVLPRLQILCEQSGARLQFVDLRWGVSEEASLDQQTMDICLSEIERCQRLSPGVNFLVLLGDRYGSRLLPARIPRAEFEALRAPLSEDKRQRLDDWYELDENANPPVYYLLSAADKFSKYNDWKPTEQALHGLLLEGLGGLPLGSYDPARYNTSATEQEIVKGVLEAEDSPKHVHCFYRTITNREDLEADLARTRTADPGKRAEDYVNVMVDEGEDEHREVALDKDAQAQLEALKSRLDKRLPEAHIHKYEVRWTGAGLTTDHLPRLCQDVFEILAGMIQADLAHEETAPSIEREERAHRDFGDALRQHFIGREEALGAIASYLADDSRLPLLVTGVSGIGKSALLAEAWQRAERSEPSAIVLVRHIGATPSSADLRSLLHSLCQQLAHESGRSNESSALDLDSLKREFSERLAQAAPGRQLLLFIDALDQLGRVGQLLDTSWLPRELPEHVRMVVSAITDKSLEALERRLGPVHVLDLQQMSHKDGNDLLMAWLDEAKRTLQPAQREAVLRAFDEVRRPLYLKLVFGEARRWHSLTSVTETTLAPETDGTIRTFFDRLATSTEHGRQLVAHSLGYLGAAKEGLAEDELLKALSLDDVVMNEFRSHASTYSPDTHGKLPTVIWSRLYFDLEPYLSERNADDGPLLGFYHRQVAEFVSETYLLGEEGKERHDKLAYCFTPNGKQASDDGRPKYSHRGLVELPYQLTEGQSWDDLYALLTNFAFLEQKAATDKSTRQLADIAYSRTYGGVYALQDDFAHAVAAWRRTSAAGQAGEAQIDRGATNLRTLSAITSALSKESPRIAKNPELLWQHLYNDLQWQRDEVRQALAPELARRKGAGAAPWLHVTFPRPLPTLARAFVLETDTRYDRHEVRPVEACAISPDSTLVAAAGSGLLRVWDLLEARVVFEDIAPSTICAFGRHANGDMWLAVGGSTQKSNSVGLRGAADFKSFLQVRLFETQTWQERTYEWPDETEGIIRTGTISPDGRWCVFARDRRYEIGDLISGTLTVVDSGLPENIYVCATSPDGSLLALGDESGIIGICETATWQARQIIVPDQISRQLRDTIRNPLLKSVEWRSGAISHDNALLAAGGSRGRVKIWDLASGSEVPPLVQSLTHSDDDAGVTGCAFSAPDRRRFVSAGSDGCLRLWDTSTWEPLAMFTASTARIRSCAISLDGQHLLAGSDDSILRVWNAEATSRDDIADVNHTNDIKSCRFSPDGKRYLTTSEDKTAKLWDTATNALLHTLSGHREEIRASAFGPDGQIAITGADNEVIRVWDVRTGDNLAKRPDPPKPPFLGRWIIRDCASSPDGAWIVSALSNRLQRWRTHTWTLESEYVGHHDEVHACAVSPDGTWIASAGDDKDLIIWDAEHGSILHRLEVDDKVRRCAIAPDGTFVVAATSDWEHLSHLSGYLHPRDQAIMVWETTTWQRRQTLMWPRSQIVSCAVSPDAQYVIGATTDGQIRIWSVANGQEQAAYSLGDRLFCLGLHPWKPIAIGGGVSGAVYMVGFEPIAFGPIIVTARQHANSLELPCPVCQQVHPTDSAQLGRQLACPTNGCGALLRQNHFTLAISTQAGAPTRTAVPIDANHSTPLDTVSSYITPTDRPNTRRFWPFKRRS